MNSPYILWLEDFSQDRLAKVGGKSMGLSKLFQSGWRIPSGFTVSADLCEEFLHLSGLTDLLVAPLPFAARTDADAVEQAAQAIKRRIMANPMSTQGAQAITLAYQELATRRGIPDLPVAVRSSGTAEDGSSASFAGQYETFLWVRGAEQVLDKVVQCWASLFNARALSYRLGRGSTDDPAPGRYAMSVVVQEMVDARSSGVMFTLNPVNGDRSKIVLEACWGFGVSVVNGEGNPDRFVIDKVALEILQRQIAHKEAAYVVNHNSTAIERVSLASERRLQPCLEDAEALELARAAKAIERLCGCPQDIEWAIDVRLPFPSSIHFLQSRAETVWSQRAVASPAQHQPKTYFDGLLEKMARNPVKS